MRRHIVRAFVAMAAGGTALLTAGLTAATAAAQTAGTHAASYPTVATTTRAGYMDTGRWFRFVATTVKVPGPSPYGQYARVVLKGQNLDEVILGIKPGGGAGSVAYGVGNAPFGTSGHALPITPAVGDTMLIDLYYNKTDGGLTITAEDLTSHVTKAVTISEGTKAVFNKAEVGVVLTKPSTPPATDVRLWQFTNTGVTTNTGVHGTVIGPWTTSQVIDTVNGSPTGSVVMSPSNLFNNGANFGVWLRQWLTKTGS